MGQKVAWGPCSSRSLREGSLSGSHPFFLCLSDQSHLSRVRGQARPWHMQSPLKVNFYTCKSQELESLLSVCELCAGGGCCTGEEGGTFWPTQLWPSGSLRTKLINKWHAGSLKGWEGEEGGTTRLECDKSRTEWQQPRWHRHCCAGLAGSAVTPPRPAWE